MKLGTLLAVVAVLGLVGVAMAQDAATRPSRDPNMRPLMGQVVKVDGDKVTVKRMARPGTEANEVVVTTDAKTTVTIDGAEKKVADLTKDLYVTITPATGVAQKIVATKEAPARGGRRGRGGAATN
jgi:hypothetical protein